MSAVRIAALVAVGLSACATSGPVAAPAAVIPDGIDLLDQALIASGYEDASARADARRSLELELAPLVAGAEAIADREARGRALLKGLHGKLLLAYDARATTLRDLLAGGRFNCLSSSILYNVLAERVGLEVGGQLLPTHARSVLRVDRGGRQVAVVVETTSPEGFDPSGEVQAAILDQVASPQGGDRRALVDQHGIAVSTAALIGVVFVNRGTIAQESGQLAEAEQLFAAAERWVADEPVKNILRDQRAALLAQLAADDIAAGSEPRLERGYRTARAALTLSPPSPEFRDAAAINLRAAAERLLVRAADAQDAPRIDALVAECAAAGLSGAELAGLRAFAGSERARLELQRANAGAALAALERALGEPLGARDQRLRGTLEHNWLAAVQAVVLAEAEQGEGDRALGRLDRALAGSLSADRRREVRDLRRRVLALSAQHRFQGGDHRGALALYRLGVADYPDDALLKHNLVAALERVVSPDLDAGRCDAATALLDEIRRADPRSDYPGRGQLRCWVVRAEQRLKEGDYAEAARALRRARGLPGDDGLVGRNLAVVLTEWARALALAGQCAEAKARLAEAQQLGARKIVLPGSCGS